MTQDGRKKKRDELCDSGKDGGEDVGWSTALRGGGFDEEERKLAEVVASEVL